MIFGREQVPPAGVWPHIGTGTGLTPKHGVPIAAGGAAVPKLTVLLLSDARPTKRWLGTEPDEIAATAEALRRFEPEHPSLVHLEVRFRRALQIKADARRNFTSRVGDARMTRNGGSRPSSTGN